MIFFLESLEIISDLASLQILQWSTSCLYACAVLFSARVCVIRLVHRLSAVACVSFSFPQSTTIQPYVYKLKRTRDQITSGWLGAAASGVLMSLTSCVRWAIACSAFNPNSVLVRAGAGAVMGVFTCVGPDFGSLLCSVFYARSVSALKHGG